MKIKKIVLSVAVIGLFFVACDDSKKKQAEAEVEAEMLKSEEEAALYDAEEAIRKNAEFETNTIAAVTMRNENFTTLASAVQTANLEETLKSEGPFTVFAPTNEAFSRIPKATLENLMKPDNKDELAGLLTYHVVKGKWTAEDIKQSIQENNNKYEVTTVQGEKLVLSLKDDKLTIKDAQGNTSTVLDVDVHASNGVIHTVDHVVMPKA